MSNVGFPEVLVEQALAALINCHMHMDEDNELLSGGWRNLKFYELNMAYGMLASLLSWCARKIRRAHITSSGLGATFCRILPLLYDNLRMFTLTAPRLPSEWRFAGDDCTTATDFHYNPTVFNWERVGFFAHVENMILQMRRYGKGCGASEPFERTASASYVLSCLPFFERFFILALINHGCAWRDREGTDDFAKWQIPTMNIPPPTVSYFYRLYRLLFNSIYRIVFF